MKHLAFMAILFFMTMNFIGWGLYTNTLLKHKSAIARASYYEEEAKYERSSKDSLRECVRTKLRGKKKVSKSDVYFCLLIY